MGPPRPTPSRPLHRTALNKHRRLRRKGNINELWKGSGCSDCHGAFANGEKERDESPTGADLRTTRLDAAALKRVISCGRTGAEMPAFMDGASAAPACGQGVGEYPAPRTLTS